MSKWGELGRNARPWDREGEPSYQMSISGESRSWSKSIPVMFLVKTLTGVVIFVIITAGAVGLELVVRWLTDHHFSKWIILGLTVAEYAVFVVDLLLLFRFLLGMLALAWRELGPTYRSYHDR